MLVPTINNRPVLLPKHNHPDFGKPEYHYHIDFRYTTDTPRQSDVIFSNEEPTYQELKQVREVYDILIPDIGIPLMLASRYDCLINGRCPHKGLPVFNGICVGHGLCFNGNDVVKEYLLCLNDIELKVDCGYLQGQYIFNCQNAGVVKDLILKALDNKSKECKIVGVKPLNINGKKYYNGDSIRITFGEVITRSKETYTSLGQEL